MEVLRDAVRHLVTLLLAAGALELLLPQGQMRGYVRVVMGLLITLTLLQPALTLARRPLDLPDLAAAVQAPPVAHAAADRLRDQAQALAVREVAQALAREAERLAGLDPEVASAQAEASLGRPEAPHQPPPVLLLRVRVTGRGPGIPPGLAGRVQERVAAGLGIPRDRVAVTVAVVKEGSP